MVTNLSTIWPSAHLLPCALPRNFLPHLPLPFPESPANCHQNAITVSARIFSAPSHSAVVQNNEESGRKYWATCSSDHSFSPTAYSSARSLTHFCARGKANDSMLQNDLILSHSASSTPTPHQPVRSHRLRIYPVPGLLRPAAGIAIV